MNILPKWLRKGESKALTPFTQAPLKPGTTSMSAMVTAISAQIFPTWQVFRDIETYRVVDEISSVVNKLATTAAALPIVAQQQNGEDLPEDSPVNKLLREFSYSERLQLFSFLFLCEEVFIYKEVIEFGPNKGVKSMHILHPNFMSVVLSMDFPTRIVGYIYRDPQINYEMKFLPEDIIFIRGWNPEIDFYTRWRGLSKVQLLRHRLTRLESNKNNSVAQMQNGGVPGLLFDKSGEFDSIERKGMRDTKMMDFFRNPDNKGLPYNGAGDVTYVAIGSSLADMDSAELAMIDLKGICNAFGLSAEVMNIDSTVRSDVTTMVQQMYTSAVKPKTVLVEEAFEKHLVPDFGIRADVYFDFSGVPELQVSKKDQMDAYSAAPTMIPNAVLSVLGLEKSPDPQMDMPWIKSGYQPLDSFEQIPPIE